jgi:hypothetical protein
MRARAESAGMRARRGLRVEVSVELLPDAPVAEVLAAIRAADDSAIDTVFRIDEIYHRDPGLPTLSEQVRLIAERGLPLVSG